MEYIKADEGHLKRIFDIVQETVRTIYPKYYPKGVVDFFCRLNMYAPPLRSGVKECLFAAALEALLGLHDFFLLRRGGGVEAALRHHVENVVLDVMLVRQNVKHYVAHPLMGAFV